MGHVLPTTRALAKTRTIQTNRTKVLMLLGFHEAPVTETMNTEARNSTDFHLTVDAV